jgi:aminobenzoyl-glutamate utilization protein B
MSIGTKAAVVAAKTLALSAAELYQSPDEIAAAKAEFNKSRGPNFVYKPLIGDRKPPLDYRKNTPGQVAQAD